MFLYIKVLCVKNKQKIRLVQQIQLIFYNFPSTFSSWKSQHVNNN